MKSIALLLLLLVVFAFAMKVEAAVRKPVKLPEYFQFCKRNDQFNDCLFRSLQDLFPRLANGIPEVGMASLDPFVEPEVKLNYRNQQVYAKAVFREARSYGFSKSTIKAVRSELSDTKMYLEIDFEVPQVILEGTFRGEARWHAIVVNAKGYTNVTLSGVTATIKITGEIKTKAGEQYMRINKFSMLPTVKGFQFYTTDLVPGNRSFNEIAKNYVNDNWKTIYKELLPIVEQYWDLSVKRQINRLFLKVPYNVLIPKE